MNIDKAIEILVDHDRLPLVYKNPDLHDALNLGIGSLKRLKELRRYLFSARHPPLPSETEE